MAEWEEVARTQEFEALLVRRRRFVVPALLVWTAWFGAFLVCCAVARGFMGSSIYEGFTVGYAWALSVIVLTWIIGWLYVRVSARSFDPLAEGRHREGREVLVGKIAAGAIGVLSIGLALVAGKGFNVQLLVGLAFSVAASANFPSLVLALFWRRFNTAGALTGVAFGLIASIGLIVLSPPVWAGPDSHDGAPFPLQNPALFSIPIGFLGCWLGTVLSSERTEARHRELRVRAETGVGAET